MLEQRTRHTVKIDGTTWRVVFVGPDRQARPGRNAGQGVRYCVLRSTTQPNLSRWQWVSEGLLYVQS